MGKSFNMLTAPIRRSSFLVVRRSQLFAAMLARAQPKMMLSVSVPKKSSVGAGREGQYVLKSSKDRFILKTYGDKKYKEMTELPEAVPFMEYQRAREFFNMRLATGLMVLVLVMCFGGVQYAKSVPQSENYEATIRKEYEENQAIAKAKKEGQK